jgi:hypothetical protein
MTRRSLILLACLLLVGCGTNAKYTPDGPPDQLPDYDWPTRCPEGHEHVRLVPVFYGLVGLTPEGRRREAAGELIRGGCMYSERHDPLALVICSECKYRFNHSRREWERFSADVTTFAPPFAPL